MGWLRETRVVYEYGHMVVRDSITMTEEKPRIQAVSSASLLVEPLINVTCCIIQHVTFISGSTKWAAPPDYI